MIKTRFHRAWLALLLACPTLSALGQTMPAPPAGAPAKPISAAEIQQLVAPFALYPDDLLAQVLMASTYPLDIVQAERWVKVNDKLKGDQLAAALETQDWDPSVKSLVTTPQVLAMMSERLEAT